MGKLIAGMLTVGLVVLLAITFIGSATTRFNLITVQPAFWLFTVGIVFVLGGGFLAASGFAPGGLFATLGVVLLFMGAYKSIWPKTSTATSHAQEVADTKAAVAINKFTAPQRIRCDSKSTTPFWDKVTGEPQVFYLINTQTRRIECTNMGGFDDITREEYKPITHEIIKFIMMQEPLTAPTPAPPTPEAVVALAPAIQPVVLPTPLPDLTDWAYAAASKPMVVATPLPQLSEGPCCEDNR